jgi:N6-adenosine-specific RNA methylase IME4
MSESLPSRQSGGRYRTIVADPPWTYDGVEWASYTHNGTGPRKVKDMPYSMMGGEAIKALPVASLADRDSRLFLWTTNRHLAVAFDVLAAWGFTYKQTLIWRKTGNPSPFSGSVAAQHHEYLMVGVRGKPPILTKQPSSVIDAPAVIFGHSAKPDCFIDMIEQVSPGPYVELFARRARFGWDYWGDESLGTAELVA